MGIREIYNRYGYYIDKNELIVELKEMESQIITEIDDLKDRLYGIREDITILEQSENLKYDEENDCWLD